MKEHTIFVGFDVHKDSIEVVWADDGRNQCFLVDNGNHIRIGGSQIGK